MAGTMTPSTEHTAVALPSGLLLGTVAGASLLAGSAFAAASWVLGRGEPVAGLAAAALVAVTTVAGLLAITPWKRRPIATWIAMWQGQTLLRLLVTPIGAWLLYSATSLELVPLALAVGLTYFLTVVSEAVVLRRSFPGAPRERRGRNP
jgi:hypothetical protein